MTKKTKINLNTKCSLVISVTSKTILTVLHKEHMKTIRYTGWNKKKSASSGKDKSAHMLLEIESQ